MAGNKHSQKKGKGRSAKRANTDGFFLCPRKTS